MIGLIKYLTVEQLSKYQDHLIISPTAFSEAQATANKRGYEQGIADRDKEMSKLPNEYADKLWKIAYERGRANERNEILSMLTTFRDKQKSHYKSMPNGYARAKEKGRFWGLERARFQVELRNEVQSND